MYTYIPELDGGKFMPTRLPLFQISHTSTKEPVPKEQNQNKPSFFPKDIFEKKKSELNNMSKQHFRANVENTVFILQS